MAIKFQNSGSRNQVSELKFQNSKKSPEYCTFYTLMIDAQNLGEFADFWLRPLNPVKHLCESAGARVMLCMSFVCHANISIYIYMCVCVCVCMYVCKTYTRVRTEIEQALMMRIPTEHRGELLSWIGDKERGAIIAAMQPAQRSFSRVCCLLKFVHTQHTSFLVTCLLSSEVCAHPAHKLSCYVFAVF
jgi:hypothetical protein